VIDIPVKVDPLKGYVKEENEKFENGQKLRRMGIFWNDLVKRRIFDKESLLVLESYLVEACNFFNDLKEIIKKYVENIPAMEKEYNIITEIENRYIIPAKKTMQKVKETLSLPLEDYAKILTGLDAIMTYGDYRLGRVSIIHGVINNGHKVKEIIKNEEGSFRAYKKKLGTKEHYEIYEPNDFGIVVYLCIDAHNYNGVEPTILEIIRLEEKKKVGEVIKMFKEEIPETGLKYTLLSPRDQTKIIEEKLQLLNEDLCAPKIIGLWFNIEKIDKFIQKLYGGNNPTVHYIG